MAELTSAAIPAPKPGEPAWGVGEREAIVYLDLACPACAASWARARDLPLRLWLRHFPIASRRPRAPALHAAAEAAGAQGRFAEMWDSLLLDAAHNDDPHLWQRAQALGLDLERFERDRRAGPQVSRVRAEFESAIRGGITSAPSAVIEGALVPCSFDRALAELAQASG